jgi:pyruvate/2-oxoglutarate dehydrogenase complex dihydrolipoamide dehydrogenase (E3) component
MKFDALIIGTGQAGPALAARLDKEGLKVAVVERGKFGGTCVNDGCTPTKALVASAYTAHMTRRAGEYGVGVKSISINMKRIKARKDALVAKSAKGVGDWMRGLKHGRLFRGHARFVSPSKVAVGKEEIEADRIFLDVGGRPLLPQLPGLDGVPFLTNVSMMDVDFVPRHLVVVGGSYVGLEFAQMYRRFGSRVTVVEMGPRLISREDEDVSEEIRKILEAENIEIRTGAECISLARSGKDIRVNLDCRDKRKHTLGSHVLLAVGRVPNTDDLGLDKAGIQVDKRGYIEVDEGLRTSNERVWALGDCNGKGAFTHTAYNDYEIVADNLLSNAGRKVSDRIPVYALYTDPPLGRVGMSDAEIKKAGIKALVGKRSMTRVARAVEKGETQGFLKIHVEESSKRILGAALLGVGCDEAVHSLIDAVYEKTPYTEVQKRVRIHPTVSELLPTTLEDLRQLS